MRRRTGLRKDKGVFAAMRLHEVLKCTTVLVVFGGMFSIPAYANPQGGTVVAGGASIAGEGTSRVTVTQTTDRAIINWNSFSIGANERTDFVQPSAGAIALNRVVGVNPSEILGMLTATGQLVLVNPNGILFGKGATVDAAGLVATTHDVDNRQFMSGGPLRFNDGGKAGASVVNQGTITIRDAGIAAFVAPHVRNAGIIQANLGTVALASARGFTLDLYGDQLISFEIGDKIAETLTTADGTPLKALVSNDGTIDAAGGRIYLTAEAAREVVNQSLNLSGIVRADSVMQDGGAIVLSGSGTVAVETGAVVSASGVSGGSVKVAAGDFATDGTVRADGSAGAGGSIAIEARAADIGGKISASGATVGGAITVQAEDAVATSAHYAADGGDGVGGRIDVTGRSVAIDAATFSAIGTDRGGLVRIGGAFQGGKTPDANQPYYDSFVGRWGTQPALASAETTFLDADTVIDVSSAAGTGGTAIVWSDKLTTFLGSIDASGAVSAGSVEISAANRLQNVVLKDVRLGAGGFLLLDPKNITIGGDPSDYPLPGDHEFADHEGDSVHVNALDLAAQLSAGTAVILQASNDIMLDAGNPIVVDNPDGDGGDLTLQAGRSITLGSSIVTDNGALTLIANDHLANGVIDHDREAGDAEIVMAGGVSINAGAGTVTIDLRQGIGKTNSGYGDVTLQAITAGNLNVYAANSINLLGAINLAEGGTALIRADEDKLGDGTITFSGGGSLGFGDDGRQAGTALLYYYPEDGYTNPKQFGSFINGGNWFADGVVTASRPGVNGDAAFMLIHNVVDLQNAIGDDGAGTHTDTSWTTRRNAARSYALSQDIDASDTRNWNSGAGFASMVLPTTGASSYGFNGLFDGHGHVIDGLVINRPAQYWISLIPFVNEGTVRQIGLTNVDFTGNVNTAGIAAGLQSPNALLEQVYVTGRIESNQRAGGLVASMAGGTIRQSWTAAVVRAQSSGQTIAVGGLVGSMVGSNAKQIIQSYSLGPVIDASGIYAGGLVGDVSDGSTLTISESYSASYVQTRSGAGGALVSVVRTAPATITDSWFDKDVSGVSAVSPSSHYNTDLNDDPALNLGKSTAELQQGLPDNWDPDVWGIIPGTSYPYLKWAFEGTPQVVSGIFHDTAVGGTVISVAVGGQKIGTTFTGANGYHYGMFQAGTFDSGDLIFGWLGDRFHTTGNTQENGNSIKKLGDGSGHVADLHFWRDTVRVESDLTTLTDVYNLSSDAWDQLAGFGNEGYALYTVDAGMTPELTLNAGIGFRLDSTNAVDFDWNRPLDATTGTVTIVKSLGGSVVQMADMALKAGALRLIGGADTDFLFGNADNVIGTAGTVAHDFAATTGGAVELRHTADYDVTIGTVGPDVADSVSEKKTVGIGAASVDISLAANHGAGNLTFANNVTTTGRQSYVSPGNIVIQNNVELFVSGQAGMALEALAGRIALNQGAKLLNSFTGDLTAFDAITLKANLADAAATNFDGISMASGAVIQTAAGAAGNILLEGRGGKGAGTGRGIYMNNGTIRSLGHGAITLAGYGGSAGAAGQQGILTQTGGEISSAYGDISITGYAGAGGGNQTGVALTAGVQVLSTGTGADAAAISITGYGGDEAGALANMRGVFLEGATTLVRSVDGEISITGYGGENTTSTGAYGVHISAAKVEATDAADIVISGIGGGTAGASDATGVYMDSGARVNSASGTIDITGTGSLHATGTTNHGVYIEGNSKVVSSGDITITGRGGASGSNANAGVYIAGEVEGLGSGDILIRGEGGGSAGTNHGVLFGGSAGMKSADGRIVLIAERGTGDSSHHLRNDVGAGLILDDSAWVAYLPDHEYNTYGDLASGSLPVWGKTIDDLSPAEATAEGNRYVFANAPTLNVSTNFSDSKTYGEVYAFATPVLGTHYQLAFVDAAQYGDVWVQETAENTGVTGAPVLSSDGTVAAARVADGPYDITIAQGTLANTAGYVFGGFTSTGKLTVAPKTLTVDGVLAQNKVYDATRNAVLVFTTDDVINDDDVTFSYTALFDDKKVGNGKSITVDGIVTLAGADASNYTLSLDADLLDGLEANITPATLVLGGSFTASDKVYDATPVAQIDAGGLSIVSGLVGGDDVAILATGATGEFADKNVGNGKVVTLATDGSGVLDGDDAGNYVIDTSGLAVVTANITPATLTITGTFTVDGKVYDGTTDATIVTNNLVLSGVFGGDDVDLIAVAAFLDKNAGNGKVVDLSGSSLDGFDADNYVLNFTGAPTATANIARRTITVTADAQTKEYGDADPTLTFTIGGLGLAAGETVSDVFTGALQRDPGEDVGTYAVSQGSLTANDNYEITTFTGADLRIDPATLTVIVDDKTRLQGEPNPVFTYVVTGYKFGDDESVISGLSVETSAEATSPAGTYAIKAWGATAMNYVFNYIDGVLTVLPANENPDIRELDNQQLAMLNQGQELAGDSLGTPESGRTINVALTDEGLIAAPGIGRTSSESLSGQASIAGSGSIAACTAGTSINSAVSNIVNVDTGSGVYCASSALPGIVR